VTGWRAVDAGGHELGPVRSTAAAALRAAPIPAWPMAVAADDGRRLDVAAVLGAGGRRVQNLLDALTAGDADVDVAALAPLTPAGPLDLPLAIVDLAAGVVASAEVDPAWMAEVERRRAALRGAVVGAGREEALEAAVHVAMLVAADVLDPADDTDVDAHVASGARLWVLAGAVVSALGGAHADPFASWAWLVAGGWWPIGPCNGRLVVSSP
jgi:hypothetical protein